jgi:hypothetical protein
MASCVLHIAQQYTGIESQSYHRVPKAVAAHRLGDPGHPRETLTTLCAA